MDAFRVGARAGILGMQVRQVSERAPVGVLDQVRDVVVGLGLGLSANDADGSPDLDLPSNVAGLLLCVGYAVGAVLGRAHTVEVHVRVLNGEFPSARRATRVHHGWSLVAVRPRLTLDVVQLVKAAVEVKRSLAGPDAANDRPPLLALLVSVVVLLL